MATMTTAPETWLSVPQAMRYLKSSREHVYAWIDSRLLTCQHLPGKQRRILQSSCDDLLRSFTQQANVHN